MKAVLKLSLMLALIVTVAAACGKKKKVDSAAPSPAPKTEAAPPPPPSADGAGNPAPAAPAAAPVAEPAPVVVAEPTPTPTAEPVAPDTPEKTLLGSWLISKDVIFDESQPGVPLPNSFTTVSTTIAADKITTTKEITFLGLSECKAVAEVTKFAISADKVVVEEGAKGSGKVGDVENACEVEIAKGTYTYSFEGADVLKYTLEGGETTTAKRIK